MLVVDASAGKRWCFQESESQTTKQPLNLLNCMQRDIDGRTYYEFEFATKANTYIRHALAVVTVANGMTLPMACACLWGATP